MFGRGLDEDRWVACRGLIAAHDYVDVERIEFDPAADAAGPVGGDESRTGTEERVDDDLPAVLVVSARKNAPRRPARSSAKPQIQRPTNRIGRWRVSQFESAFGAAPADTLPGRGTLRCALCTDSDHRN
jgi:hypothetical protein